MTACRTCGADPCVNPSFCAGSHEADAKRAAEDLGAQLTAKLEEQRKEQEQEARLKELAAKDSISYDRHRQRAAKELGIRTETLDKEVERRRRQPSTKKPPDHGKEFAKLQQAADDLIREPDVLSRFGETVQARGLIGETGNAKILYLAHTSRLFERPVSVAIKGISAGGKSFTVESVLRFFPPEAYFERTGMSEHALPYSDEDFKHRHIVIYEHAGMDSDKVSYFVRTLLSENRISYETVEKTDEGIRARVIEKMGPTGIITTTTSAALHPENETRLLSLGVIDSPAQTAAVMKALGTRAASGDAPSGDLADWQAFQGWLAAGERRVVIPYAPAIAERIPPVAVRLRRDFSTLLALIGAHALLHRSTRPADQHGRIVATLADYAVVCGLVSRLFAEGIEATVPPTVRETVEAVAAMGRTEVSLTDLAKRLHLEKSTTSARVQRAIARGLLTNNETKKGMPARIALGDPLPEERQILPDPEALEEDCSGVRSEPEGVKGRGAGFRQDPTVGRRKTSKDRKTARIWPFAGGRRYRHPRPVLPPPERTEHPNTPLRRRQRPHGLAEGHQQQPRGPRGTAVGSSVCQGGDSRGLAARTRPSGRRRVRHQPTGRRQ
jgi:hypothetical protein